MKIDFDSAITDLNKKEIKTPIDGKEGVLTLKTISVNALLAELPLNQRENPETGREKLKKFKLAEKINDGGEVELTAEDISLIKEKIGKTYATLIVGKSYELLEQEE